MASTTSRGTYYKRKTRDWFVERGYAVQLTEFMTARPIKGRMIYSKRDVFSADGIAMNGKEIVFWNAKHVTNPDTSTFRSVKSHGASEFKRHPFPPCVKLQLFMWRPRIKEPVIVEIPH